MWTTLKMSFYRIFPCLVAVCTFGGAIPWDHISLSETSFKNTCTKRMMHEKRERKEGEEEAAAAAANRY
jgi:hypothetical protein